MRYNRANRDSRAIILKVLVGFAVVATGVTRSLAHADDYSVFQQLPSLGKPHYSWPIPPRVSDASALKNFVRISRGYSIKGDYKGASRHENLEQDALKAAQVIHEVNTAHPGVDAKVAINYSVWHQAFPAKGSPTLRGPVEQQELSHLAENLITIKTTIQSFNKANQARVQVAAVLLDSEAFTVGPDADSQWNLAVDRKQTLAYRTVERIFPKASIEWFSRGAMYYSDSTSKWVMASHLTLREPGSSYSCYLYSLPKYEETVRSLVLTSELARKAGVQTVNPWISIGSGYVPNTGKNRRWEFNWDYPVEFSWRAGRLLNVDKFWESEGVSVPNSAKLILFYPEPFGRSRFWLKHFVAYVRGADALPTEADASKSLEK